MIRLGHIDYSNCVPLHAPFLEGEAGGVEIVRGVPSELNAALAAGEIDVAPCSSIEYARHADRYRILPGLAIASDGPVRSILLESAVDVRDLGGAEVRVAAASATSVVLLRAWLELRHGVAPKLVPFDQAAEPDPVGAGAAAALWIGDAALKRQASPGRRLYDLGEAWSDWVGLPFVYAVWQVRGGTVDEAGLAALHRRLLEQRDRLTTTWPALATRWAPRLGTDAVRLVAYWRDLRFGLDEVTQRGLLRFFALAAELGEAPPIARLCWFDAC